eukprot:1160425-Pelagomonas_calceolata.AAC.3
MDLPYNTYKYVQKEGIGQPYKNLYTTETHRLQVLTRHGHCGVGVEVEARTPEAWAIQRLGYTAVSIAAQTQQQGFKNITVGVWMSLALKQMGDNKKQVSSKGWRWRGAPDVHGAPRNPLEDPLQEAQGRQ